MMPRETLDRAAWTAIAESPARLVALWADTREVHALWRDPGLRLVSVALVAGRYPAFSPLRPEAAAFERAIADLFGHRPEGVAPAPLLDHGTWELSHPMAPGAGGRPDLPPAEPERTAPAWRRGPVDGALDQPLTVHGDPTGVTLRLGHAHRGVLLLMRGKTPRVAARFAARLVADSTVAHATAFARAAEDASGTIAPPRAEALRALAARLEIAAHAAGSLAGIAAEAGHARLAGPAMAVREALLRAGAASFGHRLMMDAVVPGGLSLDLGAAAGPAWAAAQTALARALPGLRRRAAEAPFVDRLARLPGALVDRVGRLLAALEGADLAAAAPDGPLSNPLPLVSGEGLGTAMGPRGEVACWLRLDGGLIGAGFLADPSWHLWPALAQAAAAATPADWPLLRAGFDPAVGGVDL